MDEMGNKILERIRKEAEPIYRGSTFYLLTIWDHALRVSQDSRKLAQRLEADEFVAEAGGLLHDIGAAKFGRDSHHITGVQEASLILLEVLCPSERIGPILQTIYSHRGSEDIAPETLEAKCVAAADSLDHFINLGELYRSAVEETGVLEMQALVHMREKLTNDWRKISPEIRSLLGESVLENALIEVSKISTKRMRAYKHRKRQGVRI